MTTRSGVEYLAGLRDGREVWLAGERVDDVTQHPALRAGAETIAAWFDLSRREEEDCLCPGPGPDEQMSVSHLIPRSPGDLERRHRGLERMARWHVGMLGRTPDYVNVSFAGFAGLAQLWADGGSKGAERLSSFREEVARRDLALTHVLVNPTIDKSLGEVAGPNGQAALHKVGTTAEGGIVVRGARVLATLAPFSDEVAVYPGQPLPGDASAYALAFSIPVSTPGVKLLCRDSYAVPGSAFDHPFSSRFDEQDAFVIFDDVEVPAERVFLDGDTEMYNRVMTRGWVANVMQQTTIRAMVRLQFAYELVTAMSEAIGATDAATRQALGEIWSYFELTRAALRAAEADAYDWGGGVWLCDDRPFRALRPSLPIWFPRVNELIKTLGSHNLLATPSEADLAEVELAEDLARTLRGAGDTGARERSLLFRTAWDFVGSALGSRAELYEMFYLASSPRSYQLAHLAARQAPGPSLLGQFLAGIEER
ncbi:MAG: 4-hydroxyphenylacetate 3-hydroxylase [Actinomycetota bacterium]|nr:4-hydroxyphenylacetate 3-hydroxylase [Actinomycetota bacterium]